MQAVVVLLRRTFIENQIERWIDILRLFSNVWCGIFSMIKDNSKEDALLQVSSWLFRWHEIANMQRLKFKCVRWLNGSEWERERKFNWMRLWCQSKVFCFVVVALVTTSLSFFLEPSRSILFNISTKSVQLCANRLNIFFLSSEANNCVWNAL